MDRVEGSSKETDPFACGFFFNVSTLPVKNTKLQCQMPKFKCQIKLKAQILCVKTLALIMVSPERAE